MNVLLIDSHHQAADFATDITGAGKEPLQQERLEPAIEVFHGAVPLGTGFGNEDRLHAHAQRQPESRD